MKEVISSVLKEHDRSMVHLAFFSDAASRIIKSGFNSDDFRIYKKSLSYFQNEVQDHCRQEEVALYPSLQEESSNPNIFEMQYEHEKICEMIEKLNLIVNKAENNEITEALLIRIKFETKSFVSLLSNHIKKEDDMIVNAARKRLTLKEFNQIFRTRKDSI